MTTLEQLSIQASSIIEAILYITIATIDTDGNPWNTPVYSAYDENYTFYWVSDRENIHSQNIEKNGKSFVVIYDSTVPEGTGFGVYIEGTSQVLENIDIQEIEKASILLAERKNKSPRDSKEYLGKYPRRVFKFTPSKIYVNLDGEKDGNFVDTRVEITDFMLN